MNLIGLDDLEKIKAEKPPHLKEPKEQEFVDEAIKKDANENNEIHIFGETSLDKLKRWMKKNDQ